MVTVRPHPHPRPLPSEPTEGEIQHAAYYLWEQEGRPCGRDLEIWLAAKARLQHAVPVRARVFYPAAQAMLRTRNAARRSSSSTVSSPA
jgi:hypothetical protein